MDINENILQAMQIVAESEANKISYDKTVVCEIINDVDRDYGKYLVEENGTRFYAYCESTKYRTGQQVYVLIPGGKYDSDQKTIISKYTSNHSQSPITYIAPFEQLVVLYNNNLTPFIINGKGYEGLRVNINDDEFNRKVIIDTDTPDFDSRFCTSLGLKCEFKCLLQKYNIESGEYGLEINLWDSTDFVEGKTKVKTLIFSSKDIFGNPFGLTSYMKQEAKLNIQNLDFKIQHIQVVFYEDDNFKAYNSDELLNVDDFPGYTFFVRNLELYYSNDITLIENHTFSIYCNNLSYQMDGENNIKTVYSKWYNIDKFNKYLGYEKDKKYVMEWQHSVDGEWKPYNTIDKFEETKNISLSKNKKREYVRAILKEGNNKYESNILTFENIDISEDPLAVDQVAALSIKLGKNSSYSYPLYNIDNTLDNPAHSRLRRELLLDVQCLSLNITAEKFLSEAQFYWYVPTSSTMLSFNDKMLEKEGYIKKSTRSRKNNVICYKTDKYKPFYYQIKPIYSRHYINNDITCVAVHNSISYKATIHFDFSSFGMNNSSYYLTIIPKLTEEKTAFIEGKTFELEALLFDADQQPIDLSNEKHITWILPDGTQVPKTPEEAGSNCFTVSKYYTDCSNIYTVKISVMDDKNQRLVNLSCKYGLPKAIEEEYCAITPTQIIYDSMGVNPKYYKDKFTLFNIDDGAEYSDVEWSIKKYNHKTSEDRYLPVIKQGNILLAQKIFVQGLETQISLLAKRGSEILWEQPIIISQNIHSSRVLNDWDGNLVIDKDNNRILSAMLGAGRKNSINEDTFDGVLMGDISNSEGDNNNIGLYGYNGGVQSFGFNINGTAFLGKTGNGQIKIDGNEGYIESGGYSFDKKNGMKIDLVKGHIDAFNFMLSAGNLLLDSSGKSGYYFKIGKDNNMVSLSSSNELDIHSNKFTLEAKDTNNSANYLGLFSIDQKQGTKINDSGSRKDWRIIAGNKFGVTSGGKVFAEDVSIKGNISSNSGQIGNWVIEDGYLKGTNESNYVYIAPPGTNISVRDKENPIRNNFIFSAGERDDPQKHPFYVKADGYVYAKNVDITGKITATSGKIGNWSIEGNYLVGTNTRSNNYTYIAAPGTISGEYVFSSGNGADLSQHNFWIKADGSFKAYEGTIGNWEVKNGYLHGTGSSGFHTYLMAPGPKDSYIMAAGPYNHSQGLEKNPFQLLADGRMIATAGRIGGWAISGSKLYSEAAGGSIYLSAPNGNTSSPVINVGDRNGSGSYFVVDGKGNMAARNASIRGQVTADKFKMYDNGNLKTLKPTTIPDTRYNLKVDFPDKVVTGVHTYTIPAGGIIGDVTVPGQGKLPVYSRSIKVGPINYDLVHIGVVLDVQPSVTTYRCIGYTYEQ